MLLPGARISAEGIANIIHGTRMSRIAQAIFTGGIVKIVKSTAAAPTARSRRESV
jgi:adenylate kinase